MYETRCKREAGAAEELIAYKSQEKCTWLPFHAATTGFSTLGSTPQPNRIAESLALPQKDHDSSPAPRTDALTADDKVKGDVIDREVPSLSPLGTSEDAIQSTQFVVCHSPLPGNHALSPFLLRAAAGTHRRWATSTRAVSGLGVETRGEAGLPSMNRGTPCSGLAALWD